MSMSHRLVLIAMLEIGALAFCGCGNPDPNASTEKRWQQLCAAGGDLSGGNYWSEDGLAEDSAFLTEDWQAFFQQAPGRAVPFLLTKLAITNEVAVEVGLWGKTTEGALAVYSIQQFLQVNWTQSPPSYVVLGKYSGIVSEEDRNAVPFLLMDLAARAELVQFFQRALVARETTKN